MRAYWGIAGLIVAVAGGALAMWQVLLPWNEGTVLTGADAGRDYLAGFAIFWLGALAVILLILGALFGPARGRRLVIAATFLGAGIVVIGIAGFFSAAHQVDWLNQVGKTLPGGDTARSSIGSGSFVAVAGGSLLAAGSIFGVFAPRPEDQPHRLDRLPGSSVDDQQPLESVKFRWR